MCYTIGIMDNKIKMELLAKEKYHALFGVHKEIFDAMLAILECAYEEMRKKGGRKRKLSALDILIILLGYHHDNRIMESFAFEYGVHKQRISEVITWAERTLSENDSFAEPSKREPIIKDTDISKLIQGAINKNEIFELIKENPIFKEIEPDNIEKILKCFIAKKSSYKKGEIIMDMGDTIEYVHILLKGNIRATRQELDGFESVFWEASSPFTIGDASVFSGIYYIGLKFIAVTDCEMLLVNAEKLKCPCIQRCIDHTQITANVLQAVAAKAIICGYKVDILSKPTIRRKILAALEYLGAGAKKFTIPYNRNEMAQFLCVDRASLSKELMKMQDEGLILFNRNEFEILL